MKLTAQVEFCYEDVRTKGRAPVPVSPMKFEISHSPGHCPPRLDVNIEKDKVHAMFTFGGSHLGDPSRVLNIWEVLDPAPQGQVYRLERYYYMDDAPTVDGPGLAAVTVKATIPPASASAVLTPTPGAAAIRATMPPRPVLRPVGLPTASIAAESYEAEAVASMPPERREGGAVLPPPPGPPEPQGFAWHQEHPGRKRPAEDDPASMLASKRPRMEFDDDGRCNYCGPDAGVFRTPQGQRLHALGSVHQSVLGRGGPPTLAELATLRQLAVGRAQKKRRDEANKSATQPGAASPVPPPHSAEAEVDTDY